MNDEELKKIWNAGQSLPTIDFDGLQRLSDRWHIKLRRKARIDAWVQGITAAVCLVPVFFYPRLIFAATLVVILGIWYVRELRSLYNDTKFEIGSIAVRQTIKTKLTALNRYFWRTRIAVYVFTPLTLIAAIYGITNFDQPSNTFMTLATQMTIPLIVAEAGAIICTEIYLKILYKPAVNELDTLLSELDTDD